jgi:DNA end-binding protein Ku
MAARAIWKGVLNVGSHAVPVKLYSAVEEHGVHFRLLHERSRQPVRQQLVDPTNDEVVPYAEVRRGFAIPEGFVILKKEELEELAPEASRDVSIERFVPTQKLGPEWLLAPSGKSNVAYRLLAATLERSDKAGMASFVMRGKQYVVAIVAEDGLLRAETLRFADALRTPKSIGLPEVDEVSAAKVKAMRAVIDHEKKATVPDKELADTYWQRLEALVEKKQKTSFLPSPSRSPTTTWPRSSTWLPSSKRASVRRAARPSQQTSPNKRRTRARIRTRRRAPSPPRASRSALPRTRPKKPQPKKGSRRAEPRVGPTGSVRPRPGRCARSCAS